MSVGKTCDDGNISIFTGDGVTVHKEHDVAFICFNVDGSILSYYVVEFVFVDDFLWDIGDLHADIFWSFERSHEIEVGNVHCHEFCTWC